MFAFTLIAGLWLAADRYMLGLARGTGDPDRQPPGVRPGIRFPLRLALEQPRRLRAGNRSHDTSMGADHAAPPTGSLTNTETAPVPGGVKPSMRLLLR